ncbi:MAG: sortase, partial [Anaerolineales bacterium]|nr:sortase [Anaerolineales bacterium]
EFQTGGTLENYRSSVGNGVDETTDQNGDENGIDDASAAVNGIRSTNYILQPNSEQTGEPQPNYTGALDDDNVNFTADFGFAELVALGNRAWFDMGAGAFYNNGILDAGETPVNNVTVQLYTSAGVEVPVGPDGIFGTGDDALGGVQTSGGGYYRFDRLFPGTYYVQIPAAEFQAGGDLFGYVSSLGAGANETSDNNLDENGIDVATLTTTGIRTQNYILLPNSEQTGEDQTNYSGALDDDNVNFTADFGFTQLVAIGNRVWFDVGNGGGGINDGIQNGAEAGVNNVDVELYRVGDIPGVTTPVATTTTDASGNYQFTNLNPGDYFVHIPASEFQAGQPLEGSVSSTGNGSNETSDQDADENGIDAASLATNGISSTSYTLQPNTETTVDDESSYTGYLDNNNVNFTADFGFLQKVAIGNVVWLDNGAVGGTPNDGIQNGTELGIPGVDLQLFNVGDVPGVDAPVKTTTSGANGYYVFDDLIAGDYFIFIPATEFQAGGTLENYRSSTGNGADEATDQNGDENGIDNANLSTNGVTSTNYTLQPNSEQTGEPQPNYTGALDDDNVNFTADFGFTELVALGNRVWFDTGAGAFYNNGILDAGETPVNAVTVQLFTAAGVEVPVGPDGILGTGDDALGGVVTSGGGYYRFDRLYPGSYYVQIPATEFQAGGDLFDYVSSLGAGANEIGDNDVDENGIDVATLTTTGIRTQNYTLLPNTERTGEDQTNYSGALDDDNVNFTADFAFTQLVAIGNRIWFDTGNGGGTSNDGIQNGAEAGVNNVDVELYRVGDTPGVTTPVAITTTDASGSYQFTNLNPGDYFIHIPASEFQAGQPLEGYVSTTGNGSNETSDQDADENGIDSALATNGISSTPYTLTPDSERTGEDQTNYTGYLDDNNVNFTADFGFLQKVAIGNVVWLDSGAGGGTVNDGIQNGTEPGIPSVDLQLYVVGNTPGVDAPVRTTTSGANGYYVFDDLLPGDYFIFIPATEFQTGGTLASYSSSTGNGANETTDQSGDENGIDNASPATNGITSTSYTLQPNSEQTGEPQPNYTGALDDDNVNFTADFGFTEAYSIGNRVWFDTDNSGTINGGEVGVLGVTVELYLADALGNPTGAAIRTTSTVAGGYYLFDNLYGGDYVVVLPASNFTGAGPLTGYWSSGTIISPAGVISEILAPDADLNVDSDDNGTLQTGGAFTGAVIAQNVVLGPTGNTESTGESDLQSGIGQGNQPDARANMTVDFGFYRVEFGNLVFADLNSDGVFNGGDTPYFNVPVQLFSADGTTEIPVGLDGILGTADDNLGGMFTNVSGGYLFSNLPEGSYQVRVFTPAGSSSTIDTFDIADSANPSTNSDDNDNGLGVGTGLIVANTLDLVAGDVGSQSNNTVNNSTGTTSNPTVDFGFVATTYSLGNRVWFDTNNNSLIDSAEVGVNGVVVELYAADLAGNPISPALASDTTTNGGYYLFDRLLAGDYVVAVAASNFAAGGVLNGYWSSATTMDSTGAILEIAAPDPDLGPDNAPGGGDDDLDSDDNGTRQTSGTFSGAVLSLPVTLGPGNIEPTSEADLESGVGQGTAPDLRGNMTVDFGFYRVGLGNLVFVDVNANGTYDAGDTNLPGATVQLLTSNGTELNVGPDGILGTSDDASGGMTTSASGTYTFTGLPQGDYIVVVTPVVGFTSTVDTADTADTTDANTNTDNNDNGIGVTIGQVNSSVVTLIPGDTGTSSNNTINNGNGTTSNPTVDFGFVGNNGALTKRLVDTNETFTSGTDIAIGEIVTYEVSINLPLGTPLTSVTITDRMDKGLAFVDCLLVEVAGVDQTGTVCPPAVSDITDPGDANTNPANPGRQVVFTIGDIPAQAAASTLVVRYRAVVLDVIENQTGVTLNNSVTWAWTGGSFTTHAEDVEIVEPDLDIDKSATPVTDVAIGTPVQFTLTIAHTAQSTADAFDVVITDILPPTLEYIPCTIVYSGLAPTTPASPAYCPAATTDLIFHWDSFPMGETATITFNARLVGTPATNSASVAWTSLPIDPGLDGLPIELSDFNTESIERWYDPLDDVNIYAVQDSVDINGTVGGDGNIEDDDSASSNLLLPTVLPATGFAPNMITSVPVQPAGKAYKNTEVWLEIPRLGVKLPIVGVPLVEGDWDVSWLWQEAGWLDGTAFPGWQGNSVLTSHVTLPNGNAGPFAALDKLKWGDRIIIHAYGTAYVYEVRRNSTISPYNTTVLQHEEDAWVTLLTCKTYNEDTGVYSNRIAVRAVLVSAKEDKTGYGSNNIR